ncbi:cold shock domain-containing protein [bacterium]|nr:cold shock domain-containing protein [bacterium]
MKVPLEIAYRDVDKNDQLEELIRQKAAKLERVCDYLVSCRVAVEHPQKEHRYRVRIDLRVPPNHEIVVKSDPEPATMHLELETVLRQTFDTARRRLQNLVERAHGEVKTHPEQQVTALIDKLFPEKDYGFLRTIDGRDVYFHRNAVVGDGFSNLRIGMGVRYVETEGENGPQATTVQVVNRPERL